MAFPALLHGRLCNQTMSFSESLSFIFIRKMPTIL